MYFLLNFHSSNEETEDAKKKTKSLTGLQSKSGISRPSGREDIVRTSVANQFKSTGKEHPAQFPDQIVLLPVLQTTKENDLVLDLFNGSGTTGKVANSLGRRYVGYDLKVY